MTDPRAVEIAKELHLLGVSHAGIVELLSQYPLDRIEMQLAYLPYRSAKRKEALIIEAVRNNYSPPKEFFYAQAEIAHPHPQALVDQGTEPGLRQTAPEAQGHGAESDPGSHPPVHGLQPGGQTLDLVVPGTLEEDGQAE